MKKNLIMVAAALVVISGGIIAYNVNAMEGVTPEQVFEEAIQDANPHRDNGTIYEAVKMTPEQVFEEAIQDANPHK